MVNNSEVETLVFSEIFPPKIGGSGKWLHDIYSRQSTGKYIFLVGGDEEAKAFDAQSSLNIVRFRYKDRLRTIMTLGGIAYQIRQIYLLLKLYRKHKFSQIHCARVLPEGFAASIVSRIVDISLVCYIHGEDIEISKYSREYRYLTQFVVNRADRIVCNSNNSKSILINFWNCDLSKIRVLHPGVDVDRFCPSADLIKLRKKLGWEKRKVILTVSRLDERKGHDKLIEALPEIIKFVPTCLYVIVGDGSQLQFDTLRKLIKEHGVEQYVYLAGRCDMEQMIECYQACDIFVLPNRQIVGNLEGFGIVLLEAQSCGKVVIAGDSGGTVETMEPNVTGFIVDCTISRNLVQPVVGLLEDEGKRERMGAEARSLMVNRFSWSKMANRASAAIGLGNKSIT